MDEVTELVSQRTGLTPDMAKKAVETVVDYLAARIPPIDGLIKTALRDPARPESSEKAGDSLIYRAKSELPGGQIAGKQ